MKGMTLLTRLIGSFVIVAVITLVVGFIGWTGSTELSHHLDEISGNG